MDYLTKESEKSESESSEETEASGASRSRAKTVYPPEYTPPKVGEQDSSHQSSPVDMTKHYKPIVRKTSYYDQPVFHETPYREDTELVARDS